MALSYPDRRSRYAGAYPWAAGTVVSQTPAVRGPAPSENFRVVTAEPPKNPETEWVQNERGEWVKETVQATPPSQNSDKDQTPQSLEPGQRPLASSPSESASFSPATDEGSLAGTTSDSASL